MILFIYTSLIIAYLVLTSISIQFSINILLKRNLELIHCFALAFTFAMVVGFSTIVLPRFISILLLFLPNLLFALANTILSPYFFHRPIFKLGLREYLPAFVSWFLIVAIAASLTSIRIMEKTPLPDGPYVYKDWSVPVALNSYMEYMQTWRGRLSWDLDSNARLLACQ